MIHLFTNGNSNVRVASYIKKGASSTYEVTSDKNYTVLTEDDKLKLVISGFEFRKEQSISNARLICYFENLHANSKLELKDEAGNIIDRVIVGIDQEYLKKKTTNYVSFDITKFINDQNKKKTMSPLYLSWHAQYNEESVNFIGFKFFDNENSKLDVENRNEYFMVSYANIEGVEKHLPFERKKLGSSGEALVNIKQGNLIYGLPLLLDKTNANQVSLQLVFNSFNNGVCTNYGKGFRGPIEYVLDTSSINDGILKLTDQTMKKVYFTKLTDDERYKLTPETSGDIYYCFSDSTYIIAEKDDTFTFVANNKKMNLKKDGETTLVNYFLFEDGTKISVNYENKLPISIDYPSGQTDEFIYASSLLKTIKSSRLGLETSFTYKDRQLINTKTERISLDFGNNMNELRETIRNTDFVYEGNKLIEIQNNVETQSLEVKYQDDKVSILTKKAFKDDGTSINGETSSFIYGNNSTVIKDNKNNSTYYHFDAYGSCIYTLDDNGVSNNFKFGTVSDSDLNAECHKIRSKYQSQSNVPNILYNGSFEFENDPLKGWKTVTGTSTNAAISKESLYGDSCLKVIADNKNNFAFAQKINQQSKGVYKLTGFYKSNGLENSTSSEIIVKVAYHETITKKSSDYYYSNKTNTEKVLRTKEYKIELPISSGKWEYFESQDIDVGADSTIEVTLSCNSEIYFDELQLTKNNFIGGHNYLRNSHFEYLDDNKVKSWVTENTDDKDGVVSSSSVSHSYLFNNVIEGNIFKLSGTEDSKEKCIYQKVNLTGDSGERLLVNCWLYGNKTGNEKLQLEIDVHYNNIKQDKLKSYKFNPSNNQDGWQVLSGLLTAEYSYDYVIVKLVHNGFNDVYFDAIQLFKSKTGSTYSYDERGNLMSVSENTSTADSSYDKNNRMTRKSCADGQQFQYSYDETTGKLIRILDNFGNDVSFEYLDNGMIKEVKSNNQTIRTEEIKDEDGYITKKDELGNVTKTAVDELGNVTTYIDAEGNVVRKVFDASGRVKEIERTFDEKNTNLATVSHTSLGKVKDISCANNSLISIDYDEFGNRLSTSINGDVLETNAYNNPSDSLINEIKIKGNYDIKKNISYDSKGNIKEIVIDGEEKHKLKYDDRKRLIEVEDLSNVKSYYFNYDLDGTLLSITDSSGDSIQYDTDNLGNVEKEIIKLNDLYVASNMVHDYEFNEADRTTFFERLSRAYQDDIIVGDHGVKGLYGAKPKSSTFRFTFDEDVKMNTSELAYAGKELSYDLEKVNIDRQNDQSNGGSFNKQLWKLNFKKSKTVYGWFRLVGKIEDKAIVSFHGKNISIKVKAVNENKLRLIANDQTKDLILGKNKISEWNMYSLSVFNQDNTTRICFYLNGNFMQMLTLNEALTESITDLTIGDKKLEDGQTGDYLESSKTPIRIAMMSIGAYFYKKINFKTIYEISKKFLFEPSELNSFSGVSFEAMNDVDADLISLNGSFTSLKKERPITVAYSDGTYKIDKTRSFEFDPELKRHVYSVFDGTLKLKDQNSCRLSYKNKLKAKGMLSIKFKPIIKDEDEQNRTIISFNNLYDNSSISFCLNSDDELIYSNSTTSIKLGLVAKHSEWNVLKIYLSGLVSLNETSKAINSLDLANTNINVGFVLLKKNGIESPTNYLNGYICDVVLSQNEITNPICNGSVLEKHDALGRKIEKSISYNNNELSKTTFEYLSPLDENGSEITNRTSTIVKKESNDILGDISYEYDKNKNIVSAVTVKNGKTTAVNYEYDGVERLIVSKVDDVTNAYEYDKNGNILMHKRISEGNTAVIKYEYDSKNREKLVKVIDNDTFIDLTYEEKSLYPISIGKTNLKWSLNQLVETASDDFIIKYEYDYMNRRIKKTSQYSETEYRYDKNKLLAESTGLIKKVFIYDANNRLVGFTYSDGLTEASYFYIKDNLGIIRNVIDSSGNVVASYKYDDFGLILNEDEIDFNFNDILYKGYVYDHETKFYLLKERYYSPSLKRFISPDKVDNIIHSISDFCQFNLYAYCDNNPIMRSDSLGQWWLSDIFNAIKTAVEVVVTAVATAVGTVVGAVVGGTVALADSIAKGESFGDTVKNTIEGIGEGAKIGATAGMSGGLILSGYIFNDDNLIESGKDIFFNDTLPLAVDFVQENIVGLLSVADAIHSLLNCPLITNTLLNSGNPLAVLIGVGIIAYNTSQSVIAEKNYIDNVELLGKNEENLIYSPNIVDGYQDPNIDINIVIDDRIYILNQNDDFYYKIKFGTSNIQSAGCEIMAVYNVLKYLDKYIPFAQLIYYFEKQNLVFGVFGAWPSHLKKLFNSLKINYYFTYDEKDIEKFDVSNYDVVIPTYFHQNFNIETDKKENFNFNDVTRYLTAHTTFMPKVKHFVKLYDTPLKKVSDKFIEVNNYDENTTFTNLSEIIHKNPSSKEKVLISCFGLKL